MSVDVNPGRARIQYHPYGSLVPFSISDLAYAINEMTVCNTKGALSSPMWPPHPRRWRHMRVVEALPCVRHPLLTRTSVVLGLRIRLIKHLSLNYRDTEFVTL